MGNRMQYKRAAVTPVSYIDVDAAGNFLTPYVVAIADVVNTEHLDYMAAKKSVESRWPDLAAQHDRLIRALEAGRPDLLSNALEAAMVKSGLSRQAEVLAALAKSDDYSSQDVVSPGVSFSDAAKALARSIVSTTLSDSDCDLIRQATQYRKDMQHDSKNARPGSLLQKALGLRDTVQNSPTGA